MHPSYDANNLAATIRALNLEQRWGLSLADQAYYQQELRLYLPPNSSPILVRRVCINYHHDHRTVTALRDFGHPQHSRAWADWTWTALQMLVRSGWPQQRHLANRVHDLTQLTLRELMHSLPRFRFQSRLNTWAYAVMLRTTQRIVQEGNTKADSR